MSQGIQSETPSQRVKRMVSEEKAPLFALILSPDAVRRNRIATLIQERFSKGPISPSRLRGGDVRATTLAALKDDIATPSLFSRAKSVIIEAVQDIRAEEARALLAMLQMLHDKRPAGITVLCTGTTLTAQSALLKFFQNQRADIVLGALEGAELTAWCKKECKSAGIPDISDDIAHALTTLADGDPDALIGAINHLALYLDGTPATEEALRALFAERLSHDEYRLLDVIARGDSGQAQILISSLLAAGKNPFLLLSMLSRSYSNYLGITALRARRAPDAEMSKVLGIPPWLLRKQLSATQKETIHSLKRAMEALILADSKLKNYSAGPEYVMSELVHSLATGQPASTVNAR